MNKMRLLDPVAEPRALVVKLVPGLGDLHGKTVGFIDNGWWSWGATLGHFKEHLVQEEGVREIVWKKKLVASGPIAPEAFADLAAKADTAIVGLAN